jgi:hypothetical protein
LVTSVQEPGKLSGVNSSAAWGTAGNSAPLVTHSQSQKRLVNMTRTYLLNKIGDAAPNDKLFLEVTA